ncbi:MAG: CRISPR-associated endonuclease Cas1, partial [Candidatus Nomurabacteria bacterium]|jgi:CRISPR/Cas system-associated endonuclease Cas1|nr:CRISPR-associated endonuclease Cas1 [Candidatus Nomurabacteria bacterium]
VSLWLPYLQSIKENKNGIFDFAYNGGEVQTRLDEVQSIMIYGDVDTDLDVRILDKIARSGVPIIIHRRTMTQPIYIVGGARPDPDDTLSAQLIKRSQSRIASHVARQILTAKMDSMKYLVKPKVLPQFASVKKLRNIEAVHAREYWKAWFAKLGHPEWTRREKNPAAVALDAQSKFISGIILRWISYHHLSPYHGFSHEPTDYPSLVYDLIEPYRGIFEAKILTEWISGAIPTERYLTSAIAITKELLDERVYVPLTRQIVTRHELLHGIVLSLKYYLLGRQRKFMVPMQGKPNGGRPPKVDFLLYGRHAGKTDFWKVADDLADKY